MIEQQKLRKREEQRAGGCIRCNDVGKTWEDFGLSTRHSNHSKEILFIILG
jgi:hypothetical protein